jgi:hypothetical protein
MSALCLEHAMRHAPANPARRLARPITWLALGLAIALPAWPATSAPALVALSVDEPGQGGGKPLKMSFVELERRAGDSLVEVSFTSGASVPLSIFILKGICTLLRARGQAYALAEEIGTAPRRIRITFPKEAGPSELRGPGKKLLAAADCATLGL